MRVSDVSQVAQGMCYFSFVVFNPGKFHNFTLKFWAGIEISDDLAVDGRGTKFLFACGGIVLGRKVYFNKTAKLSLSDSGRDPW